MFGTTFLGGFLAMVFLGGGTTAVCTNTVMIDYSPCPCQFEYDAFCAQYHKSSRNQTQCNLYCDMSRRIQEHNARPDSTYRAEVKHFHDLPRNEWPLSLGYKGPRVHREHDTLFVATQNLDPKETIAGLNWWSQGRVVDVRDQGRCGDCWAESAVALVESAYAQQNDGKLMELSVQQAAECSPTEYNRGCQGGWPIDALRYVQARGGMCNESTYPTTIGNDGFDQNCLNASFIDNCTIPIRISSVVSIPEGDESSLMEAVQMDVVSVGISVGSGFQAYAEGVYNGMFNGAVDCGNNIDNLDHAVVIVGYDTHQGTGLPFYIVRNSWSAENWGAMSGYILMQRGINVCGIAEDATRIEF